MAKKIKVPNNVSVEFTAKQKPCDKEFDMDDFVIDLNESVKFVDKADIILSVTKCRDCKPVTMKLEKVFKYGKYEYKNVDRSKRMGF